MRWSYRMTMALGALGYSAWGAATLVRHFAGTPDRGLEVLFWAPAAACLIELAGVAGEWRWLEYAGLGAMCWRSLWMFFSWDGMLFFPAWCLLGLALFRAHPRWAPRS